VRNARFLLHVIDARLALRARKNIVPSNEIVRNIEKVEIWIPIVPVTKMKRISEKYLVFYLLSTDF
jgi:hypothetical protein